MANESAPQPIEIAPQFLSFSQLIANRLFSIPDYQRAYSWKAKQRADLFEDIDKIDDKDMQFHFMATMVCLRRGKQTIETDDFARLDVVDGQQRLTTLIILCKSLSKALDGTKKNEARLKAELEQALVKDEGQSLLLLRTNHDLSTYYSDYLRAGDAPDPRRASYLADRDLADAIVECENYVGRWKKKNRLLELGAILKNRLRFIFHEIGDEAIVYTVFEVLNSRGLDVAWLDRTKSALMAVAFEKRKGRAKSGLIAELHSCWSEIYRALGLHQGLSSESLTFAATLRGDVATSKVLGKEASLKTLVDMTKSSAKETLTVSSWMLDVTRTVEALWSDRRRAAVTKISHARLLAAAIQLSKYDEGDKLRLLEQWERSTFRVFGMFRRDARTRVGDYVRLARHFTNRRNPSSAMLRSDLAKLRELATGEYAIENAVQQLKHANCYEWWEEELRYFLFRYEEHLARELGQKFNNEQWNRIWAESATRSIEHVYPQTPSTSWRGAMGRGRSAGSHLHRLGNLALLPPGLNASIGNKSFEEKKKAYTSTGLLLLKEVVAKRKWNKQAVEERERRLLDWARTAWGDI